MVLLGQWCCFCNLELCSVFLLLFCNACFDVGLGPVLFTLLLTNLLSHGSNNAKAKGGKRLPDHMRNERQNIGRMTMLEGRSRHSFY